MNMHKNMQDTTLEQAGIFSCAVLRKHMSQRSTASTVLNESSIKHKPEGNRQAQAACACRMLWTTWPLSAQDGYTHGYNRPGSACMLRAPSTEDQAFKAQTMTSGMDMHKVTQANPQADWKACILRMLRSTART